MYVIVIMCIMNTVIGDDIRKRKLRIMGKNLGSFGREFVVAYNYLAT